MSKPTGKVIVKNARLSFNNLFFPKKIGDSKHAKYSLTLICSGDTSIVVEQQDEQGNTTKITKPHSFLKNVCDAIFKEEFGKLDAIYMNWVYNPANGSGTRDKFADKNTGEYRAGVSEDSWIIDASVREEQCENGKLVVLDNGKNPMEPGDKRIYSGCYVNAIIRLYAFPEPKRGVSASLEAVQWKGHGERFVAKAVDPSSDFEEEEVDEEENEDWG